MSEQAEPRRAPERILCPNCPADYPSPFTNGYIRCRRCGTEFVAPDEGRTPHEGLDERWPEPSDGGTDAKPRLDALAEHFPTIGLCLNLASVSLWVGGYVSFEFTVVSILLITSAFVAERH